MSTDEFGELEDLEKEHIYKDIHKDIRDLNIKTNLKIYIRLLFYLDTKIQEEKNLQEKIQNIEQQMEAATQEYLNELNQETNSILEAYDCNMLLAVLNHLKETEPKSLPNEYKDVSNCKQLYEAFLTHEPDCLSTAKPVSKNPVDEKSDEPSAALKPTIIMSKYGIKPDAHTYMSDATAAVNLNNVEAKAVAGHVAGLVYQLVKEVNSKIAKMIAVPVGVATGNAYHDKKINEKLVNIDKLKKTERDKEVENVVKELAKVALDAVVEATEAVGATEAVRMEVRVAAKAGLKDMIKEYIDKQLETITNLDQ